MLKLKVVKDISLVKYGGKYTKTIQSPESKVVMNNEDCCETTDSGFRKFCAPFLVFWDTPIIRGDLQ